MLMSWPGDSGVTPCATIYSPVLQSDVAGCPTTSGRERLVGVELDVADYPASTTFRLEAAFLAAGNNTPFCVRLFDNTANVPVLDSEVCRNAGASNTIFSVRGAAFAIADGGHEYVLQGKERGGGFVYTARIIVEWTE